MLVTQGDVFDITSGLMTALTIRENNTYQRVLFFRNLSSSALSLQIEHSADGGSSWSVVGAGFTLAAGALVVKDIASTYANILRIRASGGGDDRDLEIQYARIFNDTDHIWITPIV